MNNLEFKRHLKQLVHGHHHPEEHDWGRQQAPARKTAGAKKPQTRRRRTAKAKRKANR